ncbi:MAG: hypothetical protein GC191_14435 [Azospirillum sp.]|nr:hypothetical protein [Azospirillum sp.]
MVVFRGGAELWWLRLLKPGFRHCFAMVEQDGQWLSIDALAPFMEVTLVAGVTESELVGWLRSQGMTVVVAALRRGLTRPAPWAPFTCVEAVKRVLGLHRRWLITPWQLYRHLCARDAAVPPAPCHGPFSVAA